MSPEDGSWTNTFMGNDGVPFEIELTWNRGRVEPYENGGKDTHIAFVVDDFDAWAFISSPTLRASGLRFCLPAKAKLTTE